MKRFSFTPDAQFDIEDITSYLQGLPQAPALKIGRQLQEAISLITERPGLGRIDERLSKLSSLRVLRFPCARYMIFYYVASEGVRFLGFLRGKQDIDTLMRQRLG